MKDLRYLDDKQKLLEFSYLALKNRFCSQDEFINFFNSIQGDEQKNLFLKTASFYLFLVKQGDWLVDVPGSDRGVDYLTDTYKYVAIFSLIESLATDAFVDFYSFLIRRKSQVKFPIQNKDELEFLYQKYKEEFGSIQKCISFFKSLSTQRQEALIQKLEVKGTKPTIENLSQYLYDVRSKFVHGADLILNMAKDTAIARKGKKVVICKLSINDVMNFFEDSLISYFKSGKT